MPKDVRYVEKLLITTYIILKVGAFAHIDIRFLHLKLLKNYVFVISASYNFSFR